MSMGRRTTVVAGAIAVAALIAGRLRHGAAAEPAPAPGDYPVTHTTAEWRHLLSPAQFDVLREQGTEYPWSSPLEREHRAGIFACAGCAHALYDARTKFESGTGWPSFYQPLAAAVRTASDGSLGMDRTEVHCATCGGHLGHVFNDGPRPTGLRYCMNGVAMTFKESV